MVEIMKTSNRSSYVPPKSLYLIERDKGLLMWLCVPNLYVPFWRKIKPNYVRERCEEGSAFAGVKCVLRKLLQRKERICFVRHLFNTWAHVKHKTSHREG